MRVLSIDVGAKNMGICELERDAEGVVSFGEWGVMATCESSDTRSAIEGAVRAMEEMYARTGGAGWDAVVIENQPAFKNPAMKAVQVALHAFVVIKRCSPEVVWVGGSGKNGVADGILGRDGCGRVSYRDSKRRSVDAAEAFLRAGGYSAQAEALASSKKKDDMSDSLLQALYYLGHPPKKKSRNSL